MKIAVCGSHGVGKTTLVFDIASELKKMMKNDRIGIIQENAGNCPLPINKNGTFMSQMWMICDQVKAEIEMEESYSVVVCDRSVFDPICYAMAINDEYDGEPNDLADFIDYAESLMSIYAKSYDMIILLEPNSDSISEDGLRSTDLEFRDKVADMFLIELDNLHDKGIIKRLYHMYQNYTKEEVVKLLNCTIVKNIGEEF